MFNKCYLNEWTGLHLFDHSFCLLFWPSNPGTLLPTGIPRCCWNLVLLGVQKVLVWWWLRSLFRLQWVLKGDQAHSSILSSAKSISFLGFWWLQFLFYSLFSQLSYTATSEEASWSQKHWVSECALDSTTHMNLKPANGKEPRWIQTISCHLPCKRKNQRGKGKKEKKYIKRKEKAQIEFFWGYSSEQSDSLI